MLPLWARSEYYDRADPTPEFSNYLRQNRIDLKAAIDFAGICSVLPIIDCGNGRFDYAEPDQGVPGFICEAYGDDGETTEDLVAWSLDAPQRPLTMFGRCGLLGLWAALNPATYVFDQPLQMHRSPLEWMRAGCEGAVVVTPSMAAWCLLDIPGSIAARDQAHGEELIALAQTIFDLDRIVVPLEAA